MMPESQRGMISMTGAFFHDAELNVAWTKRHSAFWSRPMFKLMRKKKAHLKVPAGSKTPESGLNLYRK